MVSSIKKEIEEVSELFLYVSGCFVAALSRNFFLFARREVYAGVSITCVHDLQ